MEENTTILDVLSGKTPLKASLDIPLQTILLIFGSILFVGIVLIVTYYKLKK